MKNLTFLLFVLSGKGIHRGLTAVVDCLELGLAESQKVIKIGDTSFGYLKNITEEAQAGNEDFFQPFIDLLFPTNDESEDKNE